MRKVLLAILDGWGHSDFDVPPSEANAIELADVPTFRRLYDGYPRTRLACSGADVGLPDGQMGNSEVGHLNLGGGRVVYQDIARIDRSIADGAFADQLRLSTVVGGVQKADAVLHIVGLVSDGGVHSHIRHFTALLGLLPPGVRVRLHCITDGRDTSPTGGIEYLRELRAACAVGDDWKIATVCGRYWTMDRDRRWERTIRGFDLIVTGEAAKWVDDVSFLRDSYDRGTTDEFIEPTGIRGAGERGVQPEDAVIVMNFRADRMRQFVEALSVDEFEGFKRSRPRPNTIVTMTEVQEGLPVTVAFPAENVRNGLSEFLASAGRRQLKVAETEKYAHVTYFFNGGEETPWEGEDRSLVPSPKVATYDLQPEMSARGVADAVVAGLDGNYDFILVNFANPDMVGHTGVIPAAVSAVEAVDACLADLLRAVDEHPEWVALITADHGNCELMMNSDGSPNTAHTTAPVDLIVYDPAASKSGGEAVELTAARLADIAPTVLGLMGLQAPSEMTGRDLLGKGE